ncbi:MAG: DNA-processing protein DprA [Parvularcula sp.]
MQNTLRPLSDEERADWLQLIRSDGIGPITFFRLLARHGSAAEAIAALPDTGSASISIATRDCVYVELDRAMQIKADLLAYGEPGYPEQLGAIADPPPLLYRKGRADLGGAAVSIVGARNASAAGKRITAELARDLGEAGLAIVSGLARGIDGAAHLASMRTGTIAVLAGGVDSIYPPEHAGLYAAIAEQGAVLSEMPPGYTARARDFPKRNRIVSGLSRGVVVVEAAERSGTLITARLANEQGRDVFAVPGSPLDPRSAGTNRLIREGATLVRHADDILEDLGRWRGAAPAPPLLAEPADAGPDTGGVRQEILDLLSPTPVHRDILVRETSAAADHVADILLDLVLEGIAEESSGGYFARTADNRSST